MKRLLALLLCCTPAFAITPDEAWFAGSLLSFSAENQPANTLAIQPYLYYGRLPGTFDANGQLQKNRNLHHVHVECDFKLGITECFGLQLDFNEVFAHSATEGSIYYGETDLYLCFQLLKNSPTLPSMRFLIGETFPNGRFKHVNSAASEVIVASAGAFATVVIFAAGKPFCFAHHPACWTLNLTGVFPQIMNVSGETRFGGDEQTKGRILEGKQFEIDLALEYKLSQPWGLALDIYYQYQESGKYKARAFAISPPSLASSSNFSLAPAIEYNFSDRLNAEAGAWFTLAGRNSSAFTIAIFTLYYRF